MRKIKFEKVVSAVSDMCISACHILPADTLCAIQRAVKTEKNPLAKSILKKYILNAEIAGKDMIPLCQDTGFAVFFVKLGSEVLINGGTITEAIAEGVSRGYQNGYLRKSIVSDPLFGRKNTGDNTPPIIHLEIVKGDKLEISFMPKGGGAENVSAVKLLNPSDGEDAVINFVLSAVKTAGGKPCPPLVIGVGIGGTFDYCPALAKKSLLRSIGKPNPNKKYAKLERKILNAVNKLNIGAQGLGGNITAFAVHIEYYPCHIASLPVAVNLNCHSHRHKTVVI